jgi:hypothetical protein
MPALAVSGWRPEQSVHELTSLLQLQVQLHVTHAGLQHDVTVVLCMACVVRRDEITAENEAYGGSPRSSP